MKIINQSPEPDNAKSRRGIKPVISYPIDNLPAYDANIYQLRLTASPFIFRIVSKYEI